MTAVRSDSLYAGSASVRQDEVNDDPHYKTQLSLEVAGRRLRFDVAQDLFSSHEIDVGTRLLLRTLLGEEQHRYRKLLDLGCGYGPIGLALKAEVPAREVRMVDRDALAVHYARWNAHLNGFHNGVTVSGSLGFDDVADTDFDLVVSNIPGKAGESVIRHLLVRTRHHLAPDGRGAVVVVSPLAEYVRSVLSGTAYVLYERSTKRYTVFHFTFPEGLEDPWAEGGFDAGVYDRELVAMRYGGVEWDATTVVGLPEFDSLGFHSELAIEVLSGIRHPSRVAFLNPGQGHVPLSTYRSLGLDSILLAGRDLLALRTTRANLMKNGCGSGTIDIRHTASLDGVQFAPVDTFVLSYPDNQPTGVVVRDLRSAAEDLVDGGVLVFSASSTLVSRCLDHLGRDVVLVSRRVKKKGFSAVALRLKRPVPRG